MGRWKLTDRCSSFFKRCMGSRIPWTSKQRYNLYCDCRFTHFTLQFCSHWRIEPYPFPLSCCLDGYSLRVPLDWIRLWYSSISWLESFELSFNHPIHDSWYWRRRHVCHSQHRRLNATEFETEWKVSYGNNSCRALNYDNISDKCTCLCCWFTIDLACSQEFVYLCISYHSHALHLNAYHIFDFFLQWFEKIICKKRRLLWTLHVQKWHCNLLQGTFSQ